MASRLSWENGCGMNSFYHMSKGLFISGGIGLLLIVCANASPFGKKNLSFFICFNAKEKKKICKYGPFKKILGHIEDALSCTFSVGITGISHLYLLSTYFSKSSQLHKVLFIKTCFLIREWR